MKKLKVLAMVGGISQDSLNQKLAKAVTELAPETVEIIRFDIARLPFFSQDIEQAPPDAVKAFKEKVRDADAVIFITPEYNRSFPGVLKNAIDWGSRPYGHNLWDEKPAGVMGATISNVGTFGAQNHLRQVLAYLNMSVMGQPEFFFKNKNSFDKNDNLTDETTEEFIKTYWQSFMNWIDLV